MTTALALAKEIDRRGLLGGPVKLFGGREFGAAATGWYYSVAHSLCAIEDAVMAHSCGYRRRGEAKDNVCGPFPTKTAALAALAEWISDPHGREWAEASLRKEDEEFTRRAEWASGAKRRKRARYRANRRARGLVD